MFSALIVYLFSFVHGLYVQKTKTKIYLVFSGTHDQPASYGKTYGILQKETRKETRNFGKTLCMIYYPATWVTYRNQI